MLAIKTDFKMQKIYTIDLLRHGKTTAGQCFLGSTDADLTESGVQKMHKVLQQNNYSRVISSPLKRCADFSQAYIKDKKIPLIIENNLREMNFGDWEGRTSAEIWETQQKQLSAFWNDPANNTPPNAEPYTDFTYRVDAVFLKQIETYCKEKCSEEQNSEQGNNTLIIAHGGVIRQMLACILSLNFQQAQKIHIDYASLSRIEYCDGHLSIRFLNHRV